MKNLHVEDCLKTLIDTIGHRMEMYGRAIGMLRLNNEGTLRRIFHLYKDESAAAIKQLAEDFELDSLQWPASTLDETNIRPMAAVDDTGFTDLCAMLDLCKNTEELCTQAYRKAIGSLDETRTMLSFHIREQAEQQYMAFNHIKTLLDCNLLNRQAV